MADAAARSLEKASRVASGASGDPGKKASKWSVGRVFAVRLSTL